ncbi:alpha/beta hydrolase [Nocardioides sp. GY 10113]|uniref:alpha/beta fold hydrolase n=1 Tax=Nocardioides sp. GY 10113 TaxID=2569761 RepID=UPI0010A76280|nr:alpha/beta hydrolase [Nocardioides sp. GY 10113]TIC88256.1 alpha/beta hydrolase [Nocardioides sp. GY 10113]
MSATSAAITATVGALLTGTTRLSPHGGGRLALELWRRPGGPARVRPEERAVHEAAEPGAVGRVVTYAWGDGRRPVLLVHGWGARSSRWADVVRALLATGHSAVAYDAWGHGATPGPVRPIPEHQRVIAELERQHGPFAGVIAHSFGAPVAIHAARQGLRADRLVTISGVGEFGYLVDTFCDRLGAGPTVNAALRRAIARRYFAGADDIWDRFSAQPLPGWDALVVHDAGDRVVDRRQADVLTEALGARLVETSGLGHGRILRDPDVIDRVVGFLDRVPA